MSRGLCYLYEKFKQPVPLTFFGKKIFFPYCQSQITGQGVVVQDEPVAFLLLEAVIAPGREGMGCGRGCEWICYLQKDKKQVLSLNLPRETFPICDEHQYSGYTLESELLYFTSVLPEKLVMQKPPQQWPLHHAKSLCAKTGLFYCITTNYIYLLSANVSFSRKQISNGKISAGLLTAFFYKKTKSVSIGHLLIGYKKGMQHTPALLLNNHSVSSNIYISTLILSHS